MKKFFKKQRGKLFFCACLIYIGFAAYYLAQAAVPSTANGLQNLQKGRELLLKNPQNASALFNQAALSFEDSFSKLRTAPNWSKPIAALPPFRWPVRLIKACHALAAAGSQAGALASSFPTLSKEEKTNPSALLAGSSNKYFQWYNQHETEIIEIEKRLNEADRELYAIPTWIMLKQQTELENLKRSVTTAHRELQTARAFTEQLRLAWGLNDKRTHTYLVLFQNDAELRPTGGFIGSYATLVASGGYLRSFEFGKDIFKLDWPLIQNDGLRPPANLATISPYWAFRDSNVEVGFLSQAGPQISRLYERATKIRPEGIIFIDASLLEDILRLTGPVTLADSTTANTLLLKAEGLRPALAEKIEKDYFLDPENAKINEPKQILANLIPVLLAKIQTVPNLSEQLAPILNAAIQRKTIQFWSASTDLEALLQASLPLDTPPGKGNWMKIVNTNLGGWKSSLNVQQKVSIKKENLLMKNRLRFTVTIERTHTGNGVWPDRDNYNFMDIYLPEEAEVESLPSNLGGQSFLPFEVQKTLGILGKVWQSEVNKDDKWKRVSLWATTPVGKSSSYKLEYTLPSTPVYQNSFTYLKQAGSAHETVDFLGDRREVQGNLIFR